MALTFGHNSLIDIETETTYGTLPTGNWKRVPLVSLDPGVSQPWERPDIIGLAGGRDEPVPLRGLLTVQPSVDVQVDLVNTGHWLRLLFGAPTTTGTTDRTHVFGSGGATLPSISLQHGNSQISANPFMRFPGLRANTMELRFRPDEPQQVMSIGMIGLNASRAAATASGTPTAATFTPFTGPVATVTRAGTALARITGGTLRYSNGLEVLREANRASAAIGEAAPGTAEVSGSIDVRMDTDTILADSEGNAPIKLAFGYSISATQSLTFLVEAAYLERTMPAVRGRAGVQATFNFRGAFDATATRALTVTLANQQAAYT
jgi:hypothetical protein